MKRINNYSSIEQEVLKYLRKKHNALLELDSLDNISFCGIGMDSLDTAELILWAEEKYDIDLLDQEAYHTKSIINFINVIFEKVNNRGN